MPLRFDQHSKIKLGEYFRYRRESLKISQEDVAKILNLKGAQHVSNVERGRAFFSTRQLITIIELYKLDTKDTKDFVSTEILHSFTREWNSQTQNTFQEDQL